MSNPAPHADESQPAQKPQGFPVQLRYCYYLRLSEAKGPKKTANGQRVFKVPADACWVVVSQDFGYGWFAILPLLSNEQVSIEKQKGLQAELGRISPSFDDTASWVLDIPERYPAKLLRNAEQKHREKPRDCHVRPMAPAQGDAKTPYCGAQLRYCYYLHLGDAEEASESIDAQPIFNVPYKRRWLLVRKYLRDGSAQIYQLTSEDETKNGWEKPFHVNLTENKDEGERKQEIVRKSKKDTWAQCILERYPEKLMREAEADFGKTRQYLDLETTRGLFKKIDAGSPGHWTVAK